MLSSRLARYAAPAVAAVAVVAPSPRPAAAVASAATWDVRTSYHLTDRCGGVSGWVQWGSTDVTLFGGIPGSEPVIQTYGEVWENPASCGGPGVHYVKLVWSWPGQTHWSSAGSGAAGPGQTAGFNSGVLQGTETFFSVGHVTVYLCSTEGTGNCNVSKAF